jgi:hypothetical protein
MPRQHCVDTPEQIQRPLDRFLALLDLLNKVGAVAEDCSDLRPVRTDEVFVVHEQSRRLCLN